MLRRIYCLVPSVEVACNVVDEMLLARWTKARRLAHARKGTALTVAAEGVAQAAAVLEQVGPGPTGQGAL